MISLGQIVAASVITGVAVGLTAAAVRWPLGWTIAAAAGSLVLIVAWRVLANTLHLNDDFVPAVSVGDVACLVLGALAPAAVARAASVAHRRRWVPAIVGGLVGFAVNVVIL